MQKTVRGKGFSRISFQQIKGLVNCRRRFSTKATLARGKYRVLRIDVQKYLLTRLVTTFAPGTDSVRPFEEKRRRKYDTKCVLQRTTEKRTRERIEKKVKKKKERTSKKQ